MGIASGIAIYFVAWCLTLFVVLPLRVTSQHEITVTQGTEPGAPMLPRMGWKVAITTVLAAPVAAAIWALIVYAN
jgi:predicted secreted protein